MNRDNILIRFYLAMDMHDQSSFNIGTCVEILSNRRCMDGLDSWDTNVMKNRVNIVSTIKVSLIL